jgi:hypothetical protein
MRSSRFFPTPLFGDLAHTGMCLHQAIAGAAQLSRVPSREAANTPPGGSATSVLRQHGQTTRERLRQEGQTARAKITDRAAETAPDQEQGDEAVRRGEPENT